MILNYKEFCLRAKRHGIYDVAFSLDLFYYINEESPYDVSTIAFISKRDEKTVRKWFSEGKIKYIDTYPYTAIGREVLDFFYRREEKRLKKQYPFIFE